MIVVVATTFGVSPRATVGVEDAGVAVHEAATVRAMSVLNLIRGWVIVTPIQYLRMRIKAYDRGYLN
jgi:hypothetical protein